MENNAAPSIFLWFDLLLHLRSSLGFLFCFNGHKYISAEPATLASEATYNAVHTASACRHMLQLDCISLDVMTRQTNTRQEHPSVISDLPREDCSIYSHGYASSWGFWRVSYCRLVEQRVIWWQLHTLNFSSWILNNEGSGRDMQSSVSKASG